MLPSSCPDRLLGLSLLFLAELCLGLLCGSLLLALTGSLGLQSLSVHLLLDNTLAGLLSLGLVDLSNCQFPNSSIPSC